MQLKQLINEIIELNWKGLMEEVELELTWYWIEWKMNSNWNVATLQDRYGLANGESVLDAQQDYDLIDAYENDTHTVMRFRRNMLTCDLNDLNITVMIPPLPHQFLQSTHHPPPDTSNPFPLISQYPPDTSDTTLINSKSP